MGVRRFEDLTAWQLAREAKLKVYALVARSTADRDFRFRDQIIESARSAPAAISEGFGRFYHPEFSYLVGVAKASLEETKNHLIDGVDRAHWSAAESAPIIGIVERAIAAATRLIAYLDSSDPPGGPSRKSRQRRSR